MADPTPDDELDDLVLDEDFINAGRREPSADERVSRAQRIARQNDHLKRQGEIADGSGKPVYQRASRRSRIIAIAAVCAVGIVVVTLIVASR